MGVCLFFIFPLVILDGNVSREGGVSGMQSGRMMGGAKPFNLGALLLLSHYYGVFVVACRIA